MHALRLDSGSHCRAAGSGPCYVLHDFHKVEAFEDTVRCVTFACRWCPTATAAGFLVWLHWIVTT